MDWERYEAEHPIIVAEKLRQPHPITLSTAARYGIPILPSTLPAFKEERYFNVKVSHHHADLALRIVDVFVRACEVRGFDLQPNPNRGSDDGVSVWIDGEAIPLRLFERGTPTPKLTLEFRQHAYFYYLAQRSWSENA